VGVRGFSRPGDYNDRILLLLNGHRLNDNVYNSALIGTEFQIDVDLIDRVEIVRGPSSSLYGTSAFFAVVNVVTRDTHQLTGLELAGEAGAFGTYRGRSTYSQRLHGVGLFLSATGYESAGQSRLFFPAFASSSTNNGFALNADADSSESFLGQINFGHFTLESVGSTRQKHIPTASFGTVFGDTRTNTIEDIEGRHRSYRPRLL
jgi:outer membrane receptor for ferrienterochelin and colicins